jgi:predicted RecB family nuclease
MREKGGLRFYSATDLVNYLGCVHATFCDLRQLTQPVDLPEDDEHAALLQEKGFEHERAYLERLRKDGRSVVEISSDDTLQGRVDATRAAMRAGADVVYQGALVVAPWHGFSDFLLRVNGVPSSLGDFAYDVADTKLARTGKPKHVVQLCVYADLLSTIQGVEPPRMHVVLGDGTEVSLRTSTVRYYYGVARGRFELFVGAPRATAAEPCGHCEFCRWKGMCEAEWEATEHLSLVANINRSQVDKLHAGGVNTLRQLAALSDDTRIPNLQAETLTRLRSQARLQVARRDTGKNQHDLLLLLPGRGFARLPKPDAGDLFFDMEGDPFYELGLEYLFGFIDEDGGQERFTVYWAHNREDEKKAFESAVDFIMARLAAHPDAHIYHYASYEESALKRLAMLHGTRETEVDNLLRRHKLVDVYKVVREALRISEPRYSIKNIEAFYLDAARSGKVKTADESIIIYERFRRLGNVAFLQEIEAYNKFDCQSLRKCRDWLLTLRPAHLPWPAETAPDKIDPVREQKRIEAEQRTAAHIKSLTDGCAPDERLWRELLAYLLEFHRREAKPKYWAMFTRQEMSDEELIDDPECIGVLKADPMRPPRPEKRSMVYSFTFPPQDFKMRVDGEVLRAGTLEPAGEIFSLEEDARRISLKLGPKWSPLADGASIIPKGPLGDDVLRGAIYRYAETVIAGDKTRYTALTDIMRKAAPRLTGQTAGVPIIAPGVDLLAGSVAAVKRLDQSYMLIQGPPGAGKTYTSSHAIVALLADGKRVGVASNSHKAINNLLKDVEAVAQEQGVRFKGIKKSSNEEQFFAGQQIGNTLKNEDATTGGHQLIAGTAWLFARPDLDQALDYLFIDEAGQVSLANVIAMGVSAKNVVLVGDQMQLSQPIQGAHPGGSGVSGLDHLLGSLTTVPPDRGIFLAITWRMHPDICRFISDAVYDGRLQSDRSTLQQRVNVAAGDDEALAPTGIRFVPVDHVGHSQKSPPEAERLKQAFSALLGKEWVDQHGERKVIGLNDILVVSPYNMQVNHLRDILPMHTRVGTVDKFQGQEAAVVLISMTTSSGDDMPRNIEFLYSRNRLNVAISRARCLSVVFASPRLLEIPCNTIEQMQLVNTLCWANHYSDSLNQSAPWQPVLRTFGVAPD